MHVYAALLALVADVLTGALWFYAFGGTAGSSPVTTESLGTFFAAFTVLFVLQLLAGFSAVLFTVRHRRRGRPVGWSWGIAGAVFALIGLASWSAITVLIVWGLGWH